MTKYTVKLYERRVYSCVVEVEAETQEKAVDLAIEETLPENNNVVWQLDDQYVDDWEFLLPEDTVCLRGYF